MSNDPAERLLETLRFERQGQRQRLATLVSLVKEALADEHKATVERIRAALHERNRKAGYPGDDFWYADMLGILDAEARRHGE